MRECYIFASFAVSMTMAVNCSSIKCRALDLDLSNRFSKDLTGRKIKLTTGVTHFSSNDAHSSASIDLFSMVHIADASYYENIKESMKQYDIILYELITDENNCISPIGSDFKRQLNTEISASATEMLASQYQLESQVDMYNFIYQNGKRGKKNNWFIADLDSSEVKRLEMSRRKLTLASFRASRFAGRSWERQLMNNFFLSDVTFITTLRYLSWLGPCPEFSCLLLDWSRWNQPTKAGGLPVVLLPIFEHISKGNFFAAKKLAFAQQLISGVPDAGSWGGEALSDIEVRIKARNTECCRILQCFLEEHNQTLQDSTSLDQLESGQVNEPSLMPIEKSNEKLKIAILYGAYHISDLSMRLSKMGLKKESASSLTAWSMDSPFTEPTSTTASSLSSPTSSSFSSVIKESPLTNVDKSVIEYKSEKSASSSIINFTEILKTYKNPLLTLLVGLLCTTYLVIGALDWFVLIDFLVEIIKRITSTTVVSKDSLISAFLNRLIEDNTNFSLTENDKIFEISFAVVYTVAYVQRHLFAQRTASFVGVQWDRGLFEDSLAEKL